MITSSVGSPPRRIARAEVLDDLRERIVDGRLPPGVWLVERTIADELGVSRVPVREALHELVADGFAERRPAGGICVREYSDTDLDELFDVRAALEPVLVRRLLAARDTAAVAALEGALVTTARALRAGDTPAAIAANAGFHDVLAAVGTGALTSDVLSRIGVRLRWLMHRHTDPAELHREHEAIVAALVAGDEVLALHLLSAHAVTSRRAIEQTRLPVTVAVSPT